MNNTNKSTKKPGFLANIVATVISTPGRTAMVIGDQAQEIRKAKAIRDLQLMKERDELSEEEIKEATNLYPGIFDKNHTDEKETPKDKGQKAISTLKAIVNPSKKESTSKALDTIRGERVQEASKTPEPFVSSEVR